MGNTMMNQTLFEDFLIQLEYLALGAEDKIAVLEEINADYKYISDLLEVLKKSKLAFAEGYCGLTKEKEEEFKDTITRRIIYKELLSKVLKECRNLYYLKKSDLYQREETKSQRQSSEQVLEQFIEKLEEFINKVNYPKNRDEIKRLKAYVEDIIALANNFEEYGAVKNIDFFEDVIEEIDLSDNEKKEIISLALINNLEMYKSKPKEVEIEEYETETEKAATLENNSKEKIEELLDEMLSETIVEEETKKSKKK